MKDAKRNDLKFLPTPAFDLSCEDLLFATVATILSS